MISTIQYVCIALLLLSPTPAIAQTSPTTPSQELDEDQLEQAYEKYVIDLDATSADRLRTILTPMAKNDSPKEIVALLHAVRQNPPRVSLQELVPLWGIQMIQTEASVGDEITESTRKALEMLAEHEDPLIAFLSCVPLTQSGSEKHAKVMHSLIHSEKPTALQQQLIRSLCASFRVSPDTDSPDDILKYLVNMVSTEPFHKPGDAAPVFRIKDTNGVVLSLEDLRGKVVVLHFWATSCGASVAELPDTKKYMDTLQLSLRAAIQQKEPRLRASEIVMICVSLDDDRSSFLKVVEKHDLKTWHNVHDSTGWGGLLSRSFGVNSLPFDVVIDGNGNVLSNDIHDTPNALTIDCVTK